MAKQPPQYQDPGYPEMKSEDYQLLGGINTKVSLYSNGPAEFRDLSNLNFINTGALTKRPGSSLFCGMTFPGYTTSFNTVPLNGLSGPYNVTSGYEFQKLDGSSYVIASIGSYLFQFFLGNFTSPIMQPCTSFFDINTDAFQPANIKPGSIFSFSAFVDRLFGCGGNEFYRMSPIIGDALLNGFKYSLPAGTSFVSIGSTNIGLGVTISGLSGIYVFGFSFVNDRGYIGPPSSGITLSLGSSNSVVYYNVGYCDFLQSHYGVTGIQLYRSEVDGVVLSGTTQVPVEAFSSSGNTATMFDFGTTLLSTAIVAPNTFYLTESGIGTSVLFVSPSVSILNPFTPRFLETFNNQLFMAGFSTAPSTFWWSQIGEPEGVEAEFSLEVRTNDGDVISGLKNYYGSLVIAKRRSMHLLSGDNPSDFLLQELSDQYGCLSHRCLVTWNNVMWFLDSKGIMEYNGANIRCVSDQIEPIFSKMNIAAAYDNACALHVKKYNELWFSIPANGSTINNQIIVYDYVAKSWTHYDGVQAQCLFNAFASFPTQQPFAGNYTGGIVYFDPTLTQDNGQTMTCTFDSIFFAARGQTTENMYRRYYLNVDPIIGFTQPINMTFKTNFGSTVQLSRTMYQSPYQSRIDFGLSARSIQASMSHQSASLSLKINGFTVESRYQRNV